MPILNFSDVVAGLEKANYFVAAKKRGQKIISNQLVLASVKSFSWQSVKQNYFLHECGSGWLLRPGQTRMRVDESLLSESFRQLSCALKLGPNENESWPELISLRDKPRNKNKHGDGRLIILKIIETMSLVRKRRAAASVLLMLTFSEEEESVRVLRKRENG